MNLRDYQSDGIDKMRHYLRKHRAVMYQLSTGGGKTVMFAFIAKNAAAKGKRVLILVHRRELIKQTCRTLTECGVEHGVIANGWAPNRSALVQVASVQSLATRDVPTPDIIVADEAHHGTARTWMDVMQRFPHARVLGFSATPCRLSGAGLGTFFEHLICGPQIGWLIKQGYLTQPKVYSIPIADFSGARVQAGDYVRKDLDALTNNRDVIGKAVDHYSKFAPGEPAIVFCNSVDHAERVAEMYRAEGYRAASVDGKMDTDIRDRRIEALDTGDLDVLTSCDLIGEGLDIRRVRVVQELRKTKSLMLYLQWIGRGLRTYEGKPDTIVLDHVGNYAVHGLPDMDRVWSLDKGVKEDNIVELQHCPQCSAIVFKPIVCPHCGYEFALPDPIEAEIAAEVDGLLERIHPEDVNTLWEKAKASGTLESYHAWGQAKAKLKGEKYKAGTGYFAFKNNLKNRSRKVPNAC